MFDSCVWYMCLLNVLIIITLQVLNKYCKLIENSDQKIETGQKYNCHETVIETLVQLKDRQQLADYHGKLKP
ncbi:hypothetical protein LSH36_177g02040 [Paralvinella palmiformis]|uniref:Uncharacterized protein n=1 Tax=Paralvinella palmiformis TaxID=53620 RepID=A0AAD9N8J9_9ANNE|nr:hypothetical protein LSH36_177g02040 [Paralvinella palmiformis]